MEEKILTISVAAYNVEPYLSQTLQSLVGTPYLMNRLEVIVVDDGSTDRTSEIAKKYVELYPDTFVLITKENGGHGSTLNVATHYANGKYFRMLDGDDWYDTQELEKDIRELETIDVDCVITPYHQVYKEKTVSAGIQNMEIRKQYNLTELISTQIQNGHMTEILAPEFAVKTDLLKNNGLCLLEKCMYTDKEYDLFVMLYSHTFMKLPYLIYQYRMGEMGQSVGIDGRKKYLLDTKKVVLSMLHTIDRRKEDVISREHLRWLYYYVLGTLQFFFESLSYASEEVNTEEVLIKTMKEVEEIDERFAEYFKEYSTYFWWQWVFSLKYKLKDGQFVIFGAGQYGKRILQYLKNLQCQPIALVDNNASLWNEERYGYKIVEPSELISKYHNMKIVIATKLYSMEVEEQLFSMGVSEDRVISFRK